MSETKREPTTVQRPLEWMKFDPVKFALLADGATLEEEGALIRLLRHLWITGPLSEAAIKRITRAAFEFIHPLLVEDGDLLTLEVVEEARTYGIRRVNQRVEAGKKSAAKRNERSTTVEREPTTVGTDVLSMSLSKSTSKSKSTSRSNSEKKERANEVEIIPEGFTVEHWRAIQRWFTYREQSKKKLNPMSKEGFIKKWKAKGEAATIAAIDNSIEKGYQGCFEPDATQRPNGKLTEDQERAARFAHIATLYPNV